MKPNREIFSALLRQDFLSFVQRVFEELSPGVPFYGNWHHLAIAHVLAQIANGDSHRLIVTLPPRSLKSILISIAWVAWKMGHDPSMRFICISYSNDLAAKLGRDCRKVMESDWYRATFPGTILSRATEAELETTKGGGRLATSIGGTLTGRGADVIVIDDPMKASDGMSATARAWAIEWMTVSLFSRLNDKNTGRIVLVMQRLHEDDPAGHLLASGGWDHLKLPAIAQNDEAIAIGNGRTHRWEAGTPLHDARESLAVLEQLQRDLGSGNFAAQYQQTPVPAGGALIQRSWLRRYDEPPRKRSSDKIVQSWDTASKNGALNDFSVCVTALVRGPDVYVLDVYRAKLPFPDLLRQVSLQADRWSPGILLIEDAASGQQLIQMLADQPSRGIPRPIACRPEGDKVTRMSARSSMIESGSLYLPGDVPWLADFETELLGFPNVRHDDQVDALAQLLQWFATRPRLRRIILPDMSAPSYWGSMGL